MPPTIKNPEQVEVKKANKTTEITPPPAPQKSGSGFATTLAFFAFTLSVAAGGGIYWMWQQMLVEKDASASTIATLQQQLESELQKSQVAIKNELTATNTTIQSQLSEAQQTLQSELDSKSKAIEELTQQIQSSTEEKIANAEENLTSARAKLGEANNSIQATQKRQQSLEVSIDGLYARLGNTSREWVIAEADYLLKIANHRLQLEQDIQTSIQALTLADKRINSLGDPALNEVRNVIAQELVTLETLPIPDPAGVAMQLTQLQTQVDQLPLSAQSLPVKQESPDVTADNQMTVDKWKELPIAIFEVLKGLVAINRSDELVKPITADQIKNLHENLQLKLEQARTVLLRSDQKLYDENMKLAIAWTEKHFNTDEVATKKFVDTLNYLKDKQIVLNIPDISSSLRTLRKVAKRLEMNIPNMESDASAFLSQEATNLAMK